MAFDPLAPPIELNRDDLQIVLLECPYDTIRSEETQRIFGKIASMKITGYLQAYPYGVMPVDATDFIATHLLLCKKTDNQLVPLVGMKSVTASRSKIHNLIFPVLNLFKGEEVNDYQRVLESLLTQIEGTGQQVAYNSSWTIAPEVKEDKLLMQFCRDISVFFLIQYYLDYGIPHVFAGATLRFKVEAYKEFVGYEYLSDQGVILPPFECKPFFNERVAIMYLHQIRKEAIAWAARYLPLWNKRLVISRPVDLPLPKVA